MLDWFALFMLIVCALILVARLLLGAMSGRIARSAHGSRTRAADLRPGLHQLERFERNACEIAG